ncbi:uncharacterized protein ATNIH1004_002171 [Aspergillus tanneri]|uniref:Mid2 domain-containing protein n=1 Tax=Aspergillus tanneri TaxID=1220188 RepID=A0A5M9MVZ0_9EURO|nr:uncharacterized protein ATNIH1004_002171 [Aspergillus tanneri]KAA8649500.1 hypothetical protein ATNIH1004_002171 [Aspergillus tanneri]
MNFATSRDVTVTRTDFVSNKITFQKTPLKTDLHLFAVGLVYATPTATNADSTATATETTSSTSTSTSEPSRTDESSISGGAAAGIGIGSAAGVVFIAILAWFIYRRRQASRIMASRGNEYRGAQYDMKSLPGSAHPRELDAQRPTQQFLGELAG